MVFMGIMLVGIVVVVLFVVCSLGLFVKVYLVGKVLFDNSKIVLKAGDTVVLLDDRGIRILSGLGSFSSIVLVVRVRVVVWLACDW